MLYSDGTADFYCPRCGEKIGRYQYMGFCTALCVKCQHADVRETEAPTKLPLLKLKRKKTSEKLV